MAATLPNELTLKPRKMLALRGESPRKDVAGALDGDDDEKREFGRLCERAMNFAGMTAQDATHRMGYKAQSSLSRILSGADVPPALARLLKLPRVRAGFAMALAEAGEDPHFAVKTILEVAHTLKAARQ